MNPAIQFYHLLTTPLAHALPKLMERARSAEMNVVIHGDETQIAELDKALWAYDPASFLPHGTEKDKHADQQPIYLTTGWDCPNGATLLVIANGDVPESYGEYERVFDVFDGGDDTLVANARTRWKGYMDTGYALTYIRQNDAGGWDKVKEVAASTSE